MAEMNFDGASMSAVVSVPATINMDGVTASVVTRLAGTTQFKRTPRVELLEAFTVSTGIAIDPTKYDIGPVVNDTPATARATIDLIALESSGKRRSTPIVYRRRDVRELISSIDMDLFKPADGFPIATFADIIATFNRLYGLTLTVNDFQAVPITPGVPTVLTTADTSHYFAPGVQVSLGRLDGTDRQFELLLKALQWPAANTLVAQQAFFTKDTFRVEFNKLFNDTFTAPQTQVADVSAPSAGPTTSRDRQISLTFTVGQTVTNKTVYYFRVSLAELPQRVVTKTVWDILPGKFLDAVNVAEFATMAGLPFDANEFVNVDIADPTPAGTIDVTFKAAPNSKFFKGESTLTLTRAPWITNLVPNGYTFSL
jgi:hypothetical protein